MALDWLPVVPDLLPRPSRRAFDVCVQNLDPIVNPAPPTELTWLPSYPDRLVRRLTPPSRMPAVFRDPQVPVPDLRWLPNYPARLPRLRLYPSRQPAVFAPSPAILRVAVTGQWRPTYPTLLRRALRRPQSLLVVPIAPATLLAAAPCVEWTEETLTRPQLTGQTCARALAVETIVPYGAFVLEDGSGNLLLEDGSALLLEVTAGGSLSRPQMIEETLC